MQVRESGALNAVDQKGSGLPKKQLDGFDGEDCLSVYKDVNRTVGGCFMYTSCTVSNASQNLVRSNAVD